VIRDGQVDEPATRALRARLTGEQPPPPDFDFGPARERYERLWRDDLATALLDRLERYPRPLRRYLKQQVSAELSRRHAETGEAVTLAALGAALERAAERAGLGVR